MVNHIRLTKEQFQTLLLGKTISYASVEQSFDGDMILHQLDFTDGSMLVIDTDFSNDVVGTYIPPKEVEYEKEG